MKKYFKISILGLVIMTSVLLAPNVAFAGEAEAFVFIANQMDKFFSDPSKPRLVESFAEPYQPALYDSITGRSDAYNIAFIYDNALAAIALISKGTETPGVFDADTERAKMICQAVDWCFNHDPDGVPRLREAYYADQDCSGPDPATIPEEYTLSWSRLGAMSWAIIALVDYYQRATDPDNGTKTALLNTAIAIGDYIDQELVDPNGLGYFHNKDKWDNIADYKSTEQNIDCYAAFMRLYDATGDINWKTRAEYARDYVESCWDGAEKKFWSGSAYIDAVEQFNTHNLVEDANSWGNLVFGPCPEYHLALDWIENNLYCTDNGFSGVDFGYNINEESGPDGVWFEGNAHMAGAYQSSGHYGFLDYSAEYINQLDSAQYLAQYPLNLYVYNDQYHFSNHYFPSGWIGWTGDLNFDDGSTENPHDGTTCEKLTYTPSGGGSWVGVYWLHPADNWGAVKGGYDLRSYQKLTFWARVEQGEGVIDLVKIGGIAGDYPDTTEIFYPDALDISNKEQITLTNQWQQYTIDFPLEADLSYISGGFYLALRQADNPSGTVIYLDEIKYEGVTDAGVGAIPAASREELSTGFDYFKYYITPYVGATAWYIFALQELNPFWGISNYNNIPYVNCPVVLDPIGNKNVYVNKTLKFKVTAIDPDNDNLAYSVAYFIGNYPEGARFYKNPRDAGYIFCWQPDASQAGSYRVNFQVTDGEFIASETITITVKNQLLPKIKIYIPRQR